VDHNEDLLPVLFFTRTKQGNRYAQQDKKETHKKGTRAKVENNEGTYRLGKQLVQKQCKSCIVMCQKTEETRK